MIGNALDHQTPDAPVDEIPSEIVCRWRVCTPFSERRLEGIELLDSADWRDLEWAVVEAAMRGIVNLATLHGREDDRNTVVAAVTLRASAPRLLRMRFGFSNRIRVYLNGRPIYRGNDEWRSRDYRFLGTIGLFDGFVLPPQAGENQLWLAMSEDFGGWGVTALVPDTTGAEVTENRQP